MFGSILECSRTLSSWIQPLVFELSREVLDLTKKGSDKKSIMKDWNEFLEHYQGDLIVDSKKSKFFEQKGQIVRPEKKVPKNPVTK